MIRRVVIFGASGDLTSRYLLPALVQLDATGCLPEELQILGVAREAWDTETFRRHIAAHLDRHRADLDLGSRQAVTAMLTYRLADVTDPSQVARAIDPSGGPLVAYLALPPSVFAPTIEALAAIGLPEDCRIVIEKPFGANLAAARALNQLLHQTFPEHAVFRIDHFLGKQTVQNVLGLRFANRVFEPLWNSHHIQRVEIIWDETLALEGRATYYDTAGALKDMLQNHLLQLLC
ncbi:MAG TPA: glucose-6-phosphate dehydrogenase, partial [Alphaproteobacteria bacterium]|nr:glucose-6-phosphate dehydrogenase [Alphaproteobacteria bacterium]